MGLDICDALNIWDKLGNEIRSRYDEDNNYIIEFIDKTEQVVGYIKTYPGQGIRWNYPQELMNAYLSSNTQD